MDDILPWVILALVLSAAWFGYEWPRAARDQLSESQSAILGWASVGLLAASATVSAACAYLAARAEE
jgi:hypothetical protein